jgi:hypothetical protein
MISSKTHNYKAPCERTMHITDTGKELIVNIDKCGSCKSILLEVLVQFINEIPRAKAVEILSGEWDKTNSIFKGYTCDKGIAGNKSCVDRLAKYLREGK